MVTVAEPINEIEPTEAMIATIVPDLEMVRPRKESNGSRTIVEAVPESAVIATGIKRKGNTEESPSNKRQKSNPPEDSNEEFAPSKGLANGEVGGKRKCPLCESMLATRMSMRSHLNQKHPGQFTLEQKNYHLDINFGKKAGSKSDNTQSPVPVKPQKEFIEFLKPQFHSNDLILSTPVELKIEPQPQPIDHINVQTIEKPTESFNLENTKLSIRMLMETMEPLSTIQELDQNGFKIVADVCADLNRIIEMRSSNS